MRPIARRLLRIGLLLALLALAAALSGWWLLRGSLPHLDGQRTLPGLTAAASIERDAIGVVSVEAADRLDAMHALGYVHAQERYFEMDLLRRSAAGELSALLGTRALERDKQVRIHRLRARATEQFDAIVGRQRELLEAYRDGVNAGLADLAHTPWPYVLLRAEPEPWDLVDSALVGYAMYFDLQDESNSRELALWRIREVLPPALYALIAHDGSEWDAPLLGDVRGNAPLPDAATLDLRRLPAPDNGHSSRVSEPAAPGSNNFAVAGRLTADGRAIVANDMHLGHGAPNLWFRARLRYADPRAPDGRVDASGFTLPGIPGVIVGSNGHIAWGFTNSYGDWLDFYRIEWMDAERTRYRTPEGEQEIRVGIERIAIKGEAPFELQIRETRWGPITESLPDGSELALRWAAHLPGALNFDLAGMLHAGDLDQALAVADTTGIPVQNLVIGDRRGRIAWRLTGQIPARRGDCDPRAPHRIESPCRWSGWLASTENPSLSDPENGRLWTANARTVDGEALALVGDGGYANGARQRQIRDALMTQQRFDERALLSIQLDDRALFLQRWWQLLQDETARNGNANLRAVAEAARAWDGHAAIDSVSYRLVRAWRLAVIERIQNGLLAPAQAALGEDFVMPDLPQIESIAWPLIQARPAHLLPVAYASWDELLADAANDIRAELEASGPLSQRRWGERNTARICHPLASALPGPLATLLCMPEDPLPGDSHMPRVQSPRFGASERMVVAPGFEADGFVHMPGGQSGHPLSPFWGAGHAAWVKGEATPFLPGPAKHLLRLHGGDPTGQ